MFLAHPVVAAARFVDTHRRLHDNGITILPDAIFQDLTALKEL